MSWKACELVWQRGWRCTISASGSTIGSAVPVWPLPICWDGDLNSHQAFKQGIEKRLPCWIDHRYLYEIYRRGEPCGLRVEDDKVPRDRKISSPLDGRYTIRVTE